MSYVVNPYMVTPAGASVTWEDPFTSDNWTSDSGSNYIDTTNNKLVRDDNASIWFELPFTPETSSVDGKFVVTFAYERTSNAWASQSYFGMCTHSNFKYNNLTNGNQWLSFMSNDWETGGGMRINTCGKYSDTEVCTWSPYFVGLTTMDSVVYCKYVFDATATNYGICYFYSDADMTTPLTVGSYNNRTFTSFASNWDDSDRTWFLFCSGYSGYSSTQNIYPIKFYNGVTEI